MDQTVFCDNLKRFRLAKNFTQEDVADNLNINTQTVSRWECGTTLPDVLTLPVLARLYEVTVDDFFKKNSVAYDNYAQRLAAVYERTRKPEDFLQCFLEYKKLINEQPLSVEDQWNYAMIHQWMLEYCKNEAVVWYDNILKNGFDSEQHLFYRACACRISLLFAIGKVEKFPNDWQLYIHGGEICEKLKKYNEAIQYYDKAGEIGTFFYDELYCKANLYEKMGNYEDAYRLYLNISEKLRRKGYDVEADMAEESSRKAKLQIAEKIASFTVIGFDTAFAISAESKVKKYS